MNFLLTAVAFIVIFSILVLIHEWGHFFVARKAGIKVEEFGFGLPPRVWGVRKGETLYSINAIPFGGFVKLLGEDSRDPKLLHDKRSFISKSPRVRTLVVIAGVFMNFLLAVVLLTIGFTFGMQPLILSGDDVLKGIDDGTIQTQPGIIVKEVTAGSVAAKVGIQKGDFVLSADGREITSGETLMTFVKAADGKPHVFEVEREGKAMQFQMVPQQGKSLGFNVYDPVFLPRVAIHDVKPDSASAKAGLMAGDVILSINDKPIYLVEEYNQAVAASGSNKFMVLRGNAVQNFIVEVPQKDTVVLTTVFADTPADKAGLKKGDVIVSLDGQAVSSPEGVVSYTKEHVGKDIKYQVNRNGESVYFTVQPQASGLIGVGLSSLYAFENSELSVYGTETATSIIKINDVRYPLWQAPGKALEESGRLGVLTVEMFVNVLHSIFTKFSVPEGVAGPVGILQLTSVFVQEGLLSLIRFMALLSLSLAIINVLPLPALDGGRLLFIVIEVVTGKKVSPKIEAIIHAAGYAVLLILILAVTYSDVLRLFS